MWLKYKSMDVIMDIVSMIILVTVVGKLRLDMNLDIVSKLKMIIDLIESLIISQVSKN